MNSYGNMLLIAIPGFVVLILLEMVWGLVVHKERQPLVDTISSLTSGMTNILKSTLGISIVIVSYPWLYSHLQLVEWPKGSAWPYVITFVFIDFTGYWVHRLQHKVNFFWTHHVIHHSSEEFNLPCALRQSISVLSNIYILTVVPLAIAGISGDVLALIAPIHLFSQFWYHTRYIGRLGFLEYIIVTPSAHRVHHAMNDAYMDKNYGQIFIIWDRMFGTFQEELATDPCVYGMRRPAQTWNPYLINFKHWYHLAKDAWHTQSWSNRLRIWFMPTGWRPADVVDKHPLFTISSMDELKKYNPTYSKAFSAFSMVHLLAILAMVCFLFFRFGEVTQTQALINGLLIMANIFGFTALLDKKLYGMLAMLLTSVGIVAYTFATGDWFGLNQFMPMGNIAVAAYFSVAAIASAWFYKTELSQTANEEWIAVTEVAG
jgi:sterol desaturase/sphingolipid hydroxylase (fatty acid hydroxylase superfamily)